MSVADSFIADYTALTSGDGGFELTDWSIVEMTGSDRQSFLHNMCTNDILSLMPGDACEAFCTDVKGKIIAHMLVLADKDRLELLMVPDNAESLIAHLDRYIIREDVTLTDRTGKSLWVYYGNRETESPAVQTEQSGKLRSCSFCGLPGFLSRADPESSQRACSQQAWEALRIEAAFPQFGIDFNNANLPQEVNRNRWAIHFNKGCYLGQETVARIDALGHVNQQVVLVQFTGEALPIAGSELHDGGVAVGRVTSGCWSPQLHSPVGLAMIRRGSNELGTRLDSTLGTATIISPVNQAG